MRNKQINTSPISRDNFSPTKGAAAELTTPLIPKQIEQQPDTTTANLTDPAVTPKSLLMFKWFKKRPLENVSNTVSTANDFFQITGIFLNTFTHVLQAFKHMPIIGTVFLGVDNLIKTITTLFDQNAPTKNKVISITLNTLVIVLAGLGVAFSGASFGFIFGLTMAGLGIMGAGFGLYNTISAWRKTRATFNQAKAAKAFEDNLRQEKYTLESNPEPTKEQRHRLDEINDELAQRKNVIKLINQRLTLQKFYKSVKEIEIAKLKKINSNHPKIKILKAEAKILKQAINHYKAEKAARDTRPDNLKKLNIQVARARTNILSSSIGTALAATGVITAVLVTIAFGPTALIAAGALSFGALVVGTAYGITNRIFQQRDKDAQLAKQAKRSEYSSEAVILEELTKTPTDTVVDLHNNEMSLSRSAVATESRETNTKVINNNSVPKKLSCEEKKKRAFVTLIRLIDSQKDMDSSPLPTLPTELKSKSFDELKSFFETQVQHASTEVLTTAYESCLSKGRVALAKFFMQQLKEYGKPASKLAKIQRDANPVTDPNYLAEGMADVVSAQPQQPFLPQNNHAQIRGN